MNPLYPSRAAVAVTPNDTVALPFTTQRVFCGGTGNLTVRMADGQLVTFTGVLAGQVLEIAVSHVMTATTTLNVVAMA